jgi:hypothetical protein
MALRRVAKYGMPLQVYFSKNNKMAQVQGKQKHAQSYKRITPSPMAEAKTSGL